MIIFKNYSTFKPYKEFKSLYEEALLSKQKNIEACCVSSYNKESNEISSRYVNIKYIEEKNLIFFSNYNSVKALEFYNHNKVAALFFWNNIECQIRIKGTIKKLDLKSSDHHFKNRERNKNILAISSSQSEKIDTYDEVIEKFEKIKKNLDSSKNISRPDYWGGYSIAPYYFEFWKGMPNRLNIRKEYVLNNDCWHMTYLEP